MVDSPPPERKTAIHQLESWLQYLERACIFVSGICLAAIAMIATVDVAFRYLFNAPLAWAYLLISQFLFAAVFFLALGRTEQSGQNIRVDFFVQLTSEKNRRVASILWRIPAIAFFILALYAGFGVFTDAVRSNTSTAGIFVWPLWPAYLFAPLGFAIVIMRLATNLLYIVFRIKTADITEPLEDIITSRYE